MKCVVPGANLKILGRAIHALAKIGDEMYVEPKKNAMSFRTVNLANSAYADFTFFENFFSYYIYGDLQENDALKCKISMRSAMAVFKTPNLLDKQVETCHIKLQPDASEIIFILKFKNCITKTHLLPILDCEILQTAYNKDSAPNQVSSQPRVLGDAVLNFHQQLMEVTLEVSPQKLLLRNYVDDTTGISNTTRTQLALSIGEFDRYVIGSETTITFCMKEFKAILVFAELISIPMSMYFESAGRPVIFALKNPCFEANLVLSTLNSDAETLTESTMVGKPDKSTTKRAPNRMSRKPRKPTSKMESRSVKASKILENTLAKNVHPAFMQEEMETRPNTSKTQKTLSSTASNKSNTDIHPAFMQEEMEARPDNSKKQNRSTSTASNKSVLRKPSENEMRHTTAEHNVSSSSSNVTSKFYKTSLTGKKLVNTVFSTITKRKSNSNESSDKQQNQNNEEMDTLEDAIIPNSPPPIKKARLIFQKCFQTTFDPTTIPGYDVILAEDSDE